MGRTPFGLHPKNRSYILRKSLRRYRLLTKKKKSVECSILPRSTSNDINDEITEEIEISSCAQSRNLGIDTWLTSDNLCDQVNTAEISKDIAQNEFVFKLKNIIVNNYVSHSLTNQLLDLLRSHECFKTLPKDARTFLETERSIFVKNVPPGQYYHFGVKCGVTKAIESMESKNMKDLWLNINVDGLPIAKSSGSQFYPILGSLTCDPEFVFLIGLYWGYEKPSDSNELLKDFVDEMLQLGEYGILLPGSKKHFNIKLNALLADAPAKSFLLKIKGHTGYSSCTGTGRSLYE